MSFNTDKCEVIIITNRKKIIDAKYYMKQIAKYLGVTIDNTLSWNSHIDIMAKKANNTTAFLRRNMLLDIRKTTARIRDHCVGPVDTKQISVKSKRYNEERHASHSVTIEEQAVYHLYFTNLSGTTSSPVDNNPKSPCYTELSINWSQYHQHLIYNQPV